MLIAGFTAPEAAAAVAIVVAAGLMRGFSGFGGSMIISPGLALIFDTTHAVAVSILLNLLVTVQLVPAALPLVRWKEIAPMSTAALLMAPLGAFVLVSLDPVLMRRGIAVIVLCFAALLATDWRYKGTPGLTANLGTGALSGFLNGATGVGGPTLVLYVLAGPGSAAEKRADIICVFGIFILATASSFWGHGLYDTTTLWRAVLIAPFFLGAAWVGTRLFSRATDRIYYRVALAVLTAIAIAALIA